MKSNSKRVSSSRIPTKKKKSRISDSSSASTVNGNGVKPSANLAQHGGLIQYLNHSSYGKFLKSINDVKEQNIQVQMKLPVIISVGEESAGKSATLERLMMSNLFPKGELFTTKMPIRVKMVNALERSCVLSFPAEKIPGYPGIKVELDLAHRDVSKEVKNIMDDIHRYYDTKGGGSFAIVPFELLVELRSPDIPTLEIVDLPGIRENPQEAKEQTTRLAEQYMAEEHALILCVMQGSINRINNSQTGGLVEKLNKQAKTLLVLTKADTLNIKECKKKIIPRVKGECPEVTAAFGVVAVINRDSDEEHGNARNPALEDSIQSEIEWFEENLPELDLNSQASCVALIKKMDKLIQMHIVEAWVPSASKQMHERLEYSKNQLCCIGKVFHESDINKTRASFEKQWSKEFNHALTIAINRHIANINLNELAELSFTSVTPVVRSMQDIKEKNKNEKVLLERFTKNPTIINAAQTIADDVIEHVFAYQKPKAIWDEKIGDFTKFITHILPANRGAKLQSNSQFFNLCRFPNLRIRIEEIIREEISQLWEKTCKENAFFLVKSECQQVKPFKANESLRSRLFTRIDKLANMLAVEDLLLPLENGILCKITDPELFCLLNEDPTYNEARVDIEDRISRLTGSLSVIHSLRQNLNGING